MPGLSAACALRKAGIGVTLYERAQGRQERLPETLYPMARTALAEHGIDASILPLEARFVSSDGGMVLKASVETAKLPMVDRAGLDLALRARAMNLGARLLAGRTIVRIAWEADGWSLTDSQGASERTSFLIDTTGKASLAGTCLGFMQVMGNPLDQRTNLFTHFERADAFPVETVTLVTARAGFFYLVPLHAHRVCVGMVSYADEEIDESSFLAVLVAKRPVQRVVQDAVRILPIIPARNFRSRTASQGQPALLIAGDALGFQDPFLWDGLSYALATGRLAGEFAAKAICGHVDWTIVAAAYESACTQIEREVAERTDAALADCAMAFQPGLLIDPHLPAALLALLLGFMRGGPDADNARRMLRSLRSLAAHGSFA